MRFTFEENWIRQHRIQFPQDTFTNALWILVFAHSTPRGSLKVHPAVENLANETRWLSISVRSSWGRLSGTSSRRGAEVWYSGRTVREVLLLSNRLVRYFRKITRIRPRGTTNHVCCSRRLRWTIRLTFNNLWSYVRSGLFSRGRPPCPTKKTAGTIQKINEAEKCS